MINNYSVSYYTKENFPSLKSAWKLLEKGNEMTYYQSYDWYDYLNEYYVPDDTYNYSSVYAVIKRDEDTVMIAPLWIVKHTFKWFNKKGIYLLGYEGWTDYVNFIYFRFDSNALVFLFNEVSKKFNLNKFHLIKLKRSFASYRFLCAKTKYKRNWTGTCVALDMPSTLEEYKMMLSKNARQNIRTAHNRLKKDGIDVRIVFDDKEVNREMCRDIREQRFVLKFQKRSLLRKLWYRIKNYLTYQFPRILPFCDYPKGCFLTVYHGDNLCSFFYYIWDDIHRQIIVQAAGVNMNYSKYSPGMISLNAFIGAHIERGDLDVIDFTTGDEPYKYAVGGKDHFIESITVEW